MDHRALGFTRTLDFQAAYNLGPALKVDGVPGPKTQAALARSVKLHRAGKPDISEHFSASDFACHCRRQYEGCRGTLVTRKLLVGLEKLTDLAGRPRIISGYRCPVHNRNIGGASTSQHLFGRAADPDTTAYLHQVKALNVFTGIGSNKLGQHRVMHVDVRPGVARVPVTWFYG